MPFAQARACTHRRCPGRRRAGTGHPWQPRSGRKGRKAPRPSAWEALARTPALMKAHAAFWVTWLNWSTVCCRVQQIVGMRQQRVCGVQPAKHSCSFVDHLAVLRVEGALQEALHARRALVVQLRQERHREAVVQRPLEAVHGRRGGRVLQCAAQRAQAVPRPRARAVEQRRLLRWTFYTPCLREIYFNNSNYRRGTDRPDLDRRMTWACTYAELFSDLRTA